MLIKSKNYKSFIIITGIIVFSLFLRLIWILKVPTVPVSDFLQYYNGAVSLVNGTGYRIYGHISAYEPVGYSLFLSIIYFFLGSSFIAAKFANLFLSCISLIFLFHISKKYIGEKYAYICTLIYGILPLNIAYTSVISTEIIFTTFFIILIYFVLNKKSTLKSNMILGILLGVLTLIKPYMMIYQGIIFLIDIINFKSLIKPLKNFFTITLILLITISPWTIRNYVVFHKLIPVSTNGGYNLYINNNPDAIGAWRNPTKIHGNLIQKYKNKNDNFWDEVKVDEEGKKAAFHWILQNPESFLKLGLKKVKNTFLTSDSCFWSTDYLSTGNKFKYKSTLQLINKKIHLFTLILMILYFGLIIIKLVKGSLKSVTVHAIIILNVIFFLVITFVFEGQPRYLFPLWPIFILAIVYTFKSIYSIIRKET